MNRLYFEMGYTRAVIKGKWKYLALRYPERASSMSIEERTRVLEQFNDKQKEHAKRILTTDPTAPFSHISLIPGGGGAEAASTGKRPGYYDADQLYDLSQRSRRTEQLGRRSAICGRAGGHESASCGPTWTIYPGASQN